MKRDLREYSKQTDRRLIFGALLILLVIGGGLIWYFYGAGGAGLGLTCVLAALSPVILILAVFLAADWILRHAGRK